MKLLAPMLLVAVSATPPVLAVSLDAEIQAVDPKVLAWRRDIHQNPELSNREVRTSKLVEAHLRKLGLVVTTGIAHHGVVGLLETGRSGPTLAMRADMDALPVTERTNVPFRSTVKANYRGEEVGVMHACGHDSHTAILMGVAEALVRGKAQLRGKVLFVFQPAEEGVPAGENGGASMMVEEGLIQKFKPDAMVGLHVSSTLNVGQIGYRGGPLMAGSHAWRVVVNGKQTHGARPWGGTDPIVTAAQIVNSLQTVVSRQVDITENPAVVSVGAIKGGVRNNIIPESVEMIGTIRTFTDAQKKQVVEAVTRIVQNVAEANGATATFALDERSNPVVYNHPELTQRLLPSLTRVAGGENVRQIPLVTGAEDFAYFAREVPSFFFFVGITPKGQATATAPSNHSPDFFLDEAALPLATRAFAALAVDYLTAQ